MDVSRRADGPAASLALEAISCTPHLVLICDARLRPRFLNAAGRRMLGLDPGTDVGAFALGDFFTAHSRPVFEGVTAPAMLREGRWEGELVSRDFGDPTRELKAHWSAAALRNGAGELIGAAAFATGAAPADARDDGLRGQRMLLTSVLNSLPVAVGVYDRDGALLHSNEQLRVYTGLSRLPSHLPAAARRWRGFDAGNHPIAPADYPGARALRGDPVVPGLDFLYTAEEGAPERWLRVSAVPLRLGGGEVDHAIVVVQDVDDLKRAAERIERAGAELASQSRFLDATLSSIPDYVYAFDRRRRFAYANPTMAALFGLPAADMLGKTFADLDYPADLAARLNGHIDRVLETGETVEDEVFFRSRTGKAAYFGFRWGPVHAADGSVELVVGVSRDTTERRAVEETLARSEARLRAAGDLVGLGVYAWDPVTGALDWDERLREMWGLGPDDPVDMDVFESGIHPDDLPRVRSAVAACADPAGDGRYHVEYRVRGRRDGVMRYIATSGRANFAEGRAVGFIGAAIDVTAQRRAEAAIRASEAQFRSFAAHSSNLIWIVDPAAGAIIYRSAAFERIWGVPSREGPADLAAWMEGVHPDDRGQVRHALAAVEAGEVARYAYRIVRPIDGATRWLRDTSFPIPDETGAVATIGGITEDLTIENVRQVYVVSAKPVEARRLAALVRGLGFRARVFESAPAFLDVAPVLAPGCVLVDLRKGRSDALSIPRELKARSVTLPTIALDGPGAGTAAVVDAMKAGAVDYIIETDEASLRGTLHRAMAECQPAARPAVRNDDAGARLARLTAREREVLTGLVEGGTNKSIANRLGISPRTVELHRAQVMIRLNAGNLAELLQIALAADLTPSAGPRGGPRGVV